MPVSNLTAIRSIENKDKWFKFEIILIISHFFSILMSFKNEGVMQDPAGSMMDAKCIFTVFF